jgi:UDP-MurNAc hydroxylase
MKFEFIANACGIFTGSKGTRILCDPWIDDGVFDGSWFHYPPLRTKFKELKNIDAIYLSHIHPDHYDERFFKYSLNTPIILLDQEPNFLKKKLIQKGYKNLILIKDMKSLRFKEFKLTMYKAFSGHIYEENFIGNLIDSALVFESGEFRAINFNDNTPTLKFSKILKKKFSKIDLAMLNYNAAGPYPSCFDNLTIEQKKSKSKKILNRNFNHLVKIINILRPKTVLPFAGSYILGGKEGIKNSYLGTTTIEKCYDYLKNKYKNQLKINIICLNENNSYDIKNKKILKKYIPIDYLHKKKYENKILKIKYPYELDKQPNLINLKKDLLIASAMVKERVKRFNVDFKTNVYIQLNNSNKKFLVIKGKKKNNILVCKMDNRLLRRILNKKSHWNNAEIGAHINFFRKPDKMEPDIHRALCFLHL